MIKKVLKGYWEKDGKSGKGCLGLCPAPEVLSHASHLAFKGYFGLWTYHSLQGGRVWPN